MPANNLVVNFRVFIGIFRTLLFSHFACEDFIATVHINNLTLTTAACLMKVRKFTRKYM